MFYINIVAEALSRCPEPELFEEFLAQNSYLIQGSLLFDYYSDELLNRKDAKIQ